LGRPREGGFGVREEAGEVRGGEDWIR